MSVAFILMFVLSPLLVVCGGYLGLWLSRRGVL
jgi:hypothetical protein